MSCGGGRDVVTADATDGVASDCEVVTREVSSDPYANAAGQHGTEVEPDTFASGSTVVSAFQVGRVFGGGAANIGFATSRNAGRTWTRGFLPGLTPSSQPAGSFPIVSDPSVAFDALHGVWLVASLAVAADRSAVLVSSSRDAIHWNAPVAATVAPTTGDLLLDKEWIACDNGARSPFRGHCYVSYSDFRILQVSVQTSTDGGLTWTAPAGSPGAGRASLLGEGAPGVQPVATPDGTLVVPYFDEGRMAALRSTDGGATFSAPVTIAPANYRGVNPLRADALPSAEVGADGTIYVAWADCSPRAGCARNAVVVSRSSDDGATWSPRTVVPTGSADAEIPGIAADPTRGGRVAITYYTVANGALDVWSVTSRDGGTTWTAPQRLSARSVSLSWIARTSGGVMVGDYISTSFAAGRAVTVFALAFPPRNGRLREPMFANARAVS